MLGVTGNFSRFCSARCRITAVSAIGMIIVWPIWSMLFSRLFGSPLLLLMLILFLRGYVSDILKTQRSRAAFKRNLEAATLNPADASAHYNIGVDSSTARRTGRRARALSSGPSRSTRKRLTRTISWDVLPGSKSVMAMPSATLNK